MKNIVIIGATSAIAEQAARLYAQDGDHLYLLARNNERLKMISQDLKVRGAASVSTAQFDADDFSSHEALVNDIFNHFQQVDVVLVAHGSLPNQEDCQKFSLLSIKEINTNGLSVISLLTSIANKMENQSNGNITVITSVAVLPDESDAL